MPLQFHLRHAGATRRTYPAEMRPMLININLILASMAVRTTPANMAEMQMTTTNMINRSSMPTRLRRRFPNTNSRFVLARATSGRPAIGIGDQRASTGFPARGCMRRTRERCGRPVSGVSEVADTAGIVDFGAVTSATTAASITATGTRDMGMRAAAGTEIALRTIAQ